MKIRTTALTAILAFTLSPAFADPAAQNAVDNTGSTTPTGDKNTQTIGASGCKNGETTTKPDPCEEEPAESKGNSLIMNGGLRYHTWSHDYKSRLDPAGCAPCGGGATTGNASARLPELEITRTFEPLSYVREHLTFGALHGMKTYDQRFIFGAGGSSFEADDYGDMIAKRKLNFNPTLQCWTEDHDSLDQGMASVHLFTAAGTPITTAAARNTAHTVTRLNYDGSTVHFQVLWNSNGNGIARPIAFMDRHGNAIEIEYTDPQPPFGTSITDFRPYFRKSLMRDAYGREATFTYSFLYQRHVATRIDLPNGHHIAYQYIPISGGGVMLDKVTHADGTQSLWEKTVNATSRLDEYTFIDAKSDPGHRRKRVHLSSNKALAPWGGIMTTTRNRVRRAQNGTGEFTWDSRLTADLTQHYIYEGGNSVRKLTFATNGKGLTKAEHITNALWKGNFHQGNVATWTADTELHTRTNNTKHFPISNKDTRNRTTTFNRGPIDNEKLGGQFPDGTSETLTRNAFTQPLLSTDRLGRVTTLTYSPLGDLLTEKTATGTADESTRTFLYNTRGQLIEARDALYNANFPDLHNTRYEYDTNGFLEKKIDAADIAGGTRPETLFTYDTAGRLATTTDPVGRSVTYTYDAENRPTTTTYADSSTELVEYGTGLEANLVKKTTDRNGYETTYQYDAADRVTLTVIAANTDHPSTEICTYLTGTRLKQTCTLNGSKTEYLFDHRNRVIGTKVFPDTTTELTRSTELDELGRTRSTTDAYGRKTYHLYDHNDRITRTVTETVPGALNAPAFTAGASQTSANHNYTLTDKDGNTLQTNPSPHKRTHLTTYTDPRDLFLKNLTRNLNPNAPYLITDKIHDAEGQTLITTDPRGINTWMEYDKQGRNTLTIQAVGTPDETRTEQDYDDNSNPIEVRHPRYFEENIQSIDRYTYTGRNLRKTHTTAPGTPLEATQSWTYYLDGRDNEHTDFRGNTARQIWRACCARLQATIDRDGTSTTIQNTDFKGQVIHTATVSTLGAPSSSSASYPWTNPVNADTLQETTTRYDGRGRPTHTTVWLQPLGDIGNCCGGSGQAPIAGLDGIPEANGLTTTYAYDDNLTDGIGLDLTYATQLTELATRGITFGANATGSAMEITNPAGEKSAQIKDALGRTVMTINPEGHIQTMRYDEVLSSGDFQSPFPEIPLPGDLLTTVMKDALGHETITFTDGAGRTLLIQDPAGNLTGAAYDANSNRIISRDPNGLGENCTFDALNRKIVCYDLQEQLEGTTRTTTYNTHGATLTTTDAEGNTTSAEYDVRDRTITTTDANNLITAYGYDENNNRLTLTDPKGATRSWTYDERNLTVTKVMPDANDTVSYTYDALARLKVKTQQDSSTIEMIYDLAGRMTSREYSDSSTDVFTYDEASRLLTATKGRHAITVNRSYHPDGAMASESYVLDNRTYTLGREYDADNQVTSQTFADGKVMTWDYDERHLVTAASYDGKPVLTQQHDAGHRLTQQTFGNDLTREITYNRLDNLRTADKVKDGTNPIEELDFGYTYLADKNVQKETQANGTFEKLSFTAAYDAGNRVISYHRDDTYLGARIIQSWNYDAAGNWDSTTIDGTAQNRTHSPSDQLEAIAGDNLTYDSKGNQLTDNRGNEYEWDLDNRIVKSEGSGYSDIEYRYDALGRRIVREQGGDKEVLLWWGNTEQSEHKHQAGQTTIQNDLQANPSEQALNTLFARALEGSKFEIQYFHKNYLDHVMAVSADNGNLIEHYRYTAFGEPEIYAPNGTKLTETAIDNDILWNVRRYEPATGLYLYKYRDYDAVSGRWPSRDPIEERGGVNLYGFVGNNVVNQWDFLGMASPRLWYTSNQIELGECGNFKWVINWKIAPKASSVGGLVLQEMDMKGKNTETGELFLNQEYYEGWIVRPNTTTMGHYKQTLFTDPDTGEFENAFQETNSDLWWQIARDGIKGETTYRGWARYRDTVSEKEIAAQLPDTIQPAGGLPSIYKNKGIPQFSNSKKSGLIYRKFKVSWCCKPGATNEQRKTKVVEIFPSADRVYLPN